MPVLNFIVFVHYIFILQMFTLAPILIFLTLGNNASFMDHWGAIESYCVQKVMKAFK